MRCLSKDPSMSVRVAPSMLTGCVVSSLVAIQMIFFYQGMGMGSNFNFLRGRVNNRRPTAAVDDSNCARDVFVSLRKAGGEDVDGCKGLLIRDDIIVTSRECSRLEFTFDFAPVGNIKAWPHASLNSNLTVSSRLGFLEASPPHHYHFHGQPVRRTRMFLSKTSLAEGGAFGVNGTANVTAGVNRTVIEATDAIIACDGHKPIAHNLLVDGEMVSLGHLQDNVPEDILWEHEDIDSAPSLSFRSWHWWTKPVRRFDEHVQLRDMLKTYLGPPGSISIPDAHDDFIDRVVGILEAVDPRGHRRDCFENYFVRWREEVPFSGTHFFDWLDFGNGKWLIEHHERNITTLPYDIEHDHDCRKKWFNKDKVHYFNDEERRLHEVYMTPSEDGTQVIVRYRHDDSLVPESDFDEEDMEDSNPHLYMWDLNRTWYIVDDEMWDEEKHGLVKHTGPLAGMPGLAAGKIHFGEDGAIWGINFSSGHYRPKIQAVSMMHQWFKDQGYNTTAFHWIGQEGWSTKKCGKTKWEKIQIPGYDVTSLNQSCHEVTANPTWMLKED